MVWAHPAEGLGHPLVDQVKAAVFHEYPGSGAFCLWAPGEDPRRGEGVDEPVRLAYLEHLAGLHAVAGHVEGCHLLRVDWSVVVGGAL